MGRSDARTPGTADAAGRYVLRLYVSGVTLRSTTAIQSIKAICEEYLHGRYDLQVIDIYQQPELARRAQVVAVPALIRHLPEPLRHLVGDLSEKEKVLVGLDLLPRSHPEESGHD